MLTCKTHLQPLAVGKAIQVNEITNPEILLATLAVVISDLEIIIKSPNTHPDTAKELKYIQEYVKRAIDKVLEE